MVQIERWKIFLILGACLWALVYASPNLMGEKLRSSMPDWYPKSTINLGLDLQGGVHLLLDVDMEGVFKERVEDLEESIRLQVKEEGIKLKKHDIRKIDNGVRVKSHDDESRAAIKSALRSMDTSLDVTDTDDGSIEAIFSAVGLQEITDRTLSKSIEAVRHRVDEDGTKEPIIQRQGDRRIILQVPGEEDPERIKKLIDTEAVLSFHLVDTDRKTGSVAYEHVEGGSVRVQRRPIIRGEMLVDARPSFQEGSPVISFKLNSEGAKKFCDVTRRYTNKPFAIVLDKKVLSAPNIQSPICGGQAVITGRFTLKEVTELSLLLRAGALPAKMDIIEERTVGPSLGEDSVNAGKNASIVGMVLILIFMGLSYGRFGLYANIALIVNMALIFAMLSGLQATLTLPGIAGIVLTIGMAVDANVLIFERIREELKNGRTPLSAVDAGYSRAMTTIIDANVTTLIAAMLLFAFGTGPVKGFSVTLGIGIMTSFFSAIMVTRLFIVLWLHAKKPKELKI